MYDQIVHLSGLIVFGSAWALIVGWATLAVGRAVSAVRARPRLLRPALDSRMAAVRREKPVLSAAM